MYYNPILLLFFISIIKVNSDKCTFNNEEIIPEYYLITMCHRSEKKILATANYKSIEQCKNLAIKLRGMAFNFKGKKKRGNHTMKTCMVLTCPEYENSATIIQDVEYDYYSTFIDPIPPENATCIEGIGIFVFHLLKLNYMDAKRMCRNHGAALADVSTESRTIELSKYIAYYSERGEKNKKFYIGMDDLKIEGDFATTKCSSYRAWAPGHPKNKKASQNCVTIDSNSLWYVVDCNKKYSFICEIFPGGHYGYYDDYELIDCL